MANKYCFRIFNGPHTAKTHIVDKGRKKKVRRMRRERDGMSRKQANGLKPQMITSKLELRLNNYE